MILGLIVILLVIFAIYVDYRQFTSKVEGKGLIFKEQYPYIKNGKLYTDGFEVTLKNITEIEYVDYGMIPSYWISYRRSENKWGGLTLTVEEFDKIKMDLIKKENNALFFYK